MKNFKLTNIFFENIKDTQGLNKINKSDCNDFLSQMIFYKVDQYAYMMACSLHNAISNKRDLLPYLILCLDDEINNHGKFPVSLQDGIIVLDNSTKLFTPPNVEYKEVVTMKTFPQKINIDGDIVKVHFNPYVLALYLSDMYFTLHSDPKIESWCERGYIKFESIDKVFDIIEDKYSNRFLDLTRITFDTLYEVVELDKLHQIDRLEQFFGFEGTDLLRHYSTWSNKYYQELLNVIQGFFGKLVYS